MNTMTEKKKIADKNEPVVSVIIATYNAGKFLEECLASIAAQAFTSIEIIVIDGGSTDDTVKIAKAFDKLPLTLVSEPDKGIYDALNKGAKIAKGKWLHFLGADDILLPGFSELAAKLQDADTIYYGDSKEYYDAGVKPDFIILTGRFSKYRLAKYCMNHQAIIYPSSVFKKYHYQLKYKVLADYALNIVVWGDNDFKQEYHPVFIARYNMNGFSSLNKDELFNKEKNTLIKKYMGWPVYLRLVFKQIKKRILREP